MTVDSIARPSLFGARVSRIEDDRLLTGHGNYVADVQLPRMVEAVFLRSPSAHARITELDTEEASQAPSVLGVFAAHDMEDVSPFPDYFDYARPVHAMPLARERVLHVGAPFAVVVAKDRYSAEDAAELVRYELEELPVVATVRDGLAAGAPRLFPEWPDNVMVNDEQVDPEVAGIFASARVVSGRYRIQRHASVPMETRGVVAEYRDGRLTVWTATQIPHMVRTTLSYLLPVAERDIRVVAPDVGGGFGGKCQIYPEEIVVPWLAWRLRRPVRWIEDRAEHMVTSVHARDEEVEIEAALDDDGHVLALRGLILQDLGSGETFPAGFCPSFVLRGSLTGPYRIPHQQVTVTSVVTNKTPAGAYRGFGMPEATFVMERVMDKAAAELGIDPLEIRRRNLLDPGDLPYISASGARIDSGSHRVAFEEMVTQGARRLEHWRHEFANDPSARIGLGVANYVEGTVGSFFSVSGHWTAHDSCVIRFDPDGGVTVAVGVSSSGQGLETMVTMLAAETLSIPIGHVRVVMGDTDRTPYGLGAWGARSLGVASGAISKAAAVLREKGMKIASSLLEAAPDDVMLEDGNFSVVGSPERFVTWRDVATCALIRTMDLPPDCEPGLESVASYDPPNIQHEPDALGRVNGVATHTNSSHAALVRVDVDTGSVEVLEYLVAHDCGRILNRNLVEGQVHGGVAQGIGGALLEELPYDEAGQPLATTFGDYLLPTATDIPPIHVTHIETPAPEMPFGVKGAGEAGIIGPAASIASAIENALEEFGVRSGDLCATPFSPQSVRQLIDSGIGRVRASA